jgi:Cd2+/Zn2+-exporting ATPase
LNLATDIKELAGLGVTIQFEGKTVHVGNHRLMDSIGLQIPKQSALGTLIHVAIDHAYAGSILIADTIKKEAKQAITDLKQMGIRTVLLSGDLKGIANQVASDLGIDEVHAELLPQDKVTIFEQLNTNNKDKIAFVGDGINDAPVLARADIGIAMGGLGSDAAIEAADIVIMNDELTQVVTAMKIANKTHTIVYQNIFFALGVKAIFLVLGAFGLASMWEAVFADTGVALIAIANAMRVMRTNKL